MSQTAFRAIVRQQWMLLIRDRRLLLVSVALLLACATALATGVARNERLRLERDAAMRADARAWAKQGEVNPHSAAHFGHYVVRPVPVLSAFDPGLLDELGTVQRLEAHKQSPASARPRDSGTALNRFARFSAASALQVMAPLLVILLAFGAFSGERARTLLQQELATGADPRTLLFGRMCALSAALGLILTAFFAAGIIVLLSTGASAVDALRLLLSLAGYGAYLLAFLAIALGVSAVCRSARSALTTLLACWIVMVLLVPASAPAVVSAIHPTPPGPQIQLEVSEQVDGELDGGGSREQRPERLRQLILDKYGAKSLEELQVNLGGAVLEHSEDLSTRIYQEHFDELYRVYRRQSDLTRALATVSPLLALKPWSAALTETDFAAHHRFLSDTERYRHAFVQRLNRDILLNRPQRQDGRYVADVAALTADLDRFEPSSASIADTLRERWIDLAILIAWSAAAICFALWCAGRLRSRS